MSKNINLDLEKLNKLCFDKNGDWKYKKFEEEISVGDTYHLGNFKSGKTIVIQCIKVPYKEESKVKYYKNKYKYLDYRYSDDECLDLIRQISYLVPDYTHFSSPTNGKRIYNFIVLMSSIERIPVGAYVNMIFNMHFVKFKMKVPKTNTTYKNKHFSVFNNINIGYGETFLKNNFVKLEWHASHYSNTFPIYDIVKNHMKKL